MHEKNHTSVKMHFFCVYLHQRNACWEVNYFHKYIYFKDYFSALLQNSLHICIPLNTMWFISILE